MARLPQPGGDNGNWGNILNDYLSQTHKSDGTLKENVVTSETLAPNSVTSDAIASNAVDAVAIADGSITNAQIADGTIQEVKLSSAIQSKLNTTVANATDSATGKIQLAGDIAGTATSPKVVGIQGHGINGSTPSDGQALVYSTASSQWVPATVTGSGTISDATTSTKGIVQLAGDLAGTASSPVVTKVNGVAVSGTPASGQVLVANSSTAAVWGTPAGDGTKLDTSQLDTDQTLAANSDGKIATQKAVKSYVDSNKWPGGVYETEVGDGTSGPFTITHNLNTRAVITRIYENGPNGAEIDVATRHTGVNTIVLEPDETWTANQYHVLVVGFRGSSDIAAPTPPTLTVSAHDTSSVTLGVSGASDDTSVTGYRWYRNGSFVANTTGTSYTHNGLTPNTSYTFTATATDLAGNESVPSNTVNQATDATVTDTTAPTAPTLAVTGHTSSTVSVSVSGATDNVGVTGYNWYRDAALITSTSSTTYTHTGLSASTSYAFTATALDAVGNESVLSNQVTQLTDGAVPAVTRTAVGGGQRVTTGTTITWTHTVPSGTNRALIIGVVDSHSANLQGGSYATHTATSDIGTGSGMASLTELGYQDIGQFAGSRIGTVRLYGLLNPAVGTHTITVNIADPAITVTQLMGNSVSYANVVSFGTAVTGFSNSSAALSTTVTSATGNMVVGAAAFGATAPSGFSGTSNYSAGANVSGDGDYIIVGDAAGAASVNLTTSSTGHRWAVVSVNMVNG